MRVSLLGDVKSRVRTDIRIPKHLAERVDALCEVLGTPKNVFFVLAAIRFILELAPILPSWQKKSILWDEVEEIFQNLIKEVRKTL